MNIQGIVGDWLDTEAPSRAPEGLLRVTLDRVAGTSQQRVLWRPWATRDGDRPSRPLLAIAAALVGTSLIATLVIVGTPRPARVPVDTPMNGWVAFTALSTDPDLTTDIWIVREGRDPRAIIGSGADGVDQRCPAFAPNGTRLAYGRAHGSDYGGRGHTGAALVIADFDARGIAATAMEIDVGGTFRAPCATWSPDGRHLAFAVGRSVDSLERGFTTTSDEVWIVRVEDQQLRRVRDVFATDLEWSPDGSRLAIASGEQLLGHRADLPGDEIRLYSLGSGETRTLAGTRNANFITWAPDGSRIAYERSLERPDATGRVDEHRELVVHELGDDAEQVIASGYSTNHGIGPVWSPNGEQIVYQRVCDSRWDHPEQPCREEHDVVVVTAGPGSSWRGSEVTEIVMPQSFRQGETAVGLWPARVTWSPDGQNLLYVTLSDTCPTCAPGDQGSSPGGLFVVPVSGRVPVMLVGHDGIDAEGSGLVVPIQAWGREPDRSVASPRPD